MWPVILRDLGISAADVLRRARLPEGLLAEPGASLPMPEYFRFWTAVEDLVGDPLFPLRARSLPTEAFLPSLFAALCSTDYAAALRRLAEYKRLVLPVRMEVDEDEDTLTVALGWLGTDEDPPCSLALAELVFLLELGRRGTRERIRAVKVEAPSLPTRGSDYRKYFGVRIEEGPRPLLQVRSEDANRPFLTANPQMWSAFEPSLRQRLSELDEKAGTAERVRGVLLEALPGGESSLEVVARRLAVSTRTLQRRLRDEGTNYQRVLASTREDLARHYLAKETLSSTEIAYLLAFDDPNSFYRAFHEWTGESAESFRTKLLH